jgi:hypothetical protein
VIPLNDFLPDALAAVLRKAPLTPEKLAFAWRQAVGPAVDRISRVELVDGRLVVHVDHSQWKREIERSTTLISSRLDALLGSGVVGEISVMGPRSPRTRK